MSVIREKLLKGIRFLQDIVSCLTDADFIDTERFVTPNTDRGIDGEFSKKHTEKVCEKLNSF